MSREVTLSIVFDLDVENYDDSIDYTDLVKSCVERLNSNFTVRDIDIIAYSGDYEE